MKCKNRLAFFLIIVILQLCISHNLAGQNVPGRIVNLEDLPLNMIGRLTEDGNLIIGDGGIELIIDGPKEPIVAGKEYEFTISILIKNRNKWSTKRADIANLIELGVSPEKIIGDGISGFTMLFDNQQISVGDIKASINGSTTGQFLWEKGSEILAPIDFALTVGSGGITGIAKFLLNQTLDYAARHYLFEELIDDLGKTVNITLKEPDDLSDNEQISRLSVLFGGNDNDLNSWVNDLQSAKQIKLNIPITFKESGQNSFIFIPDIRALAVPGNFQDTGLGPITGSTGAVPVPFEFRKAFSIVNNVVSSSQLIEGKVTPIHGDTENNYTFSINYQSDTNTPPDDGKVNLIVDNSNNKELLPQNTNLDWQKGVKFSKTLSNFKAGEHEYHFEASENGKPLRFPDEVNKTFRVLKSCKGWDLSIGDASFNGVIRGENIDGSARIHNSGSKTFNKITVKTFLKGKSGTLDIDSTSILNLSPNGNEFIDYSLELPSSVPDGSYQIIVSSFPKCDTEPTNNSKSLSFVLGEELPEELYSLKNGKQSLSEGDRFSVNGVTFEIGFISSDGEIRLIEPDGGSKVMENGEINIWNTHNVAIAIDNAFSRPNFRGVDIWAGKAITSDGPEFKKENIAAYKGQEISFEADAPLSLGAFSETSEDDDIFLEGSKNPVKNWFDDSVFQGERNQTFDFDIPKNAKQRKYEFYLATYHEGSPSAYLTRLQLQVMAPPPEINGISSKIIAADDTVTITGRNFIQSSSVEFNNLVATIIKRESNSIKVIVPEGLSTGDITVITSTGASNSVSYSLVNSVGDATTGNPGIITNIPDQLMVAGEKLIIGNLNNFFADPNGDDLLFEINIDDNNLSFNPNSLSKDMLTLVSDKNASGIFKVVVNVTDADGASLSESFLVEVDGLPPLNKLTINSKNTSSGVLVKINIEDENNNKDGSTPFSRSYRGNSVTLTAPNEKDGVSFFEWQQNGSTYSINNSITTVMDEDQTLTAVYKINNTIKGDVMDEKENPIVNVRFLLSGDESSVNVSDSTGQFSFNKLTGTNYIIKPQKNNYAFIPDSQKIKLDSKDVELEDFVGKIQSTSNNPPFVSNPILDQETKINESYNFTIPANTFDDPDGDALTLNAALSDGSPLTTWLDFTDNGDGSGTFTGTPTEPGEFDIKVTATDPDELSASDTFKIVIKPSEAPLSERFVENFDDGDFINNPKWIEDNKDDRPGEVKVANKALKVVRTGAFGNGGGVGIKKSLKLPINNSTMVIFDVKASFSDVRNGSGDKNREFPISVSIIVRLEDGSDAEIRYAYNYRGGSNKKEEKLVQIAKGDVEQDAWLRAESFNVRSHFPTAQEITKIKIFGNGWNYEGWADNIKIISDDEQSPILTNEIVNQEIIVDQPFQFTIPTATFDDPDGDALTLNATLSDGAALPTWLDFTDNGDGSGSFSGTPTQPGEFDIKVTAADPGGLSASDTFTLTIDKENNSEDSGFVVFVSKRDGNSEIFKVDQDGTDETRLTQNPAEEVLPAVSPDGRSIVFYSDRTGSWELFKMNRNGSNLEQLTKGTLNFKNVSGMDWHPSGSYLLVSGKPNTSSVIQIFRIDPDGTDLKQIVNINFNGRALDATHPVFNFDGSKIYMRRNIPFNGFSSEIYVANADGSNMQQLTTFDSQGDANTPAFILENGAPKILFRVRRSSSEPRQIYKMNPDGTNQTNISNNNFNEGDVVGPGSNNTAFENKAIIVSDRDGQANLWKINSDGTNAMAITKGGAHSPDWFAGKTTNTSNSAPIVSNQIPDQETKINESYNFTIPTATFEDPDGDALTLNATLSDGSPLPSWLDFTDNGDGSGSFTGTPTQTGEFDIEVTATDPGGLSVSDTFTLTVTDQPNIFFEVNIGTQRTLGNFKKSDHTIHLTGSFNGWDVNSAPELTTKAATSDVYQFSLPLDSISSDTLFYKYFIQDQNNNIYWETPNREKNTQTTGFFNNRFITIERNNNEPSNVNTGQVYFHDVSEQDLTIKTSNIEPVSQVRALGSSYHRTVKGIVTKTTGNFVYLQESNAAVMMFSRPEFGNNTNSLAFNEDVSQGAISVGDSMAVTGITEIFDGHLQLVNIYAWQIVSRNNSLPNPQNITIDDLQSNGEEFESELVKITDLQINTNDTKFEESTRYQVSDQTGSGEINIREPRNTKWVGKDIPEEPITYVGIIKEADPVAASIRYLLEPIDLNDLRSGSGQSDISKNMTLSAGWNLVGLPVNTAERGFQKLFPKAIEGTLFIFTGGSYQQASELALATGYWVRLSAPDTVSLEGAPLDSLGIALESGWNMIAGGSNTTALEKLSDPNGLLIPGTLFEFAGAYIPSDTLEAGRGYWVRTSDAGSVAVTPASATSNPALAKSRTTEGAAQLSATDRLKAARAGMNRLIISTPDGLTQTLYLGALPEKVDPRSFSLPPAPPGARLDARFEGDRGQSSQPSSTIQLSSSGEYRPQVRYERGEAASAASRITLDVQPDEGSGTANAESYTLEPGQSSELAAAEQLRIRIAIDTQIDNLQTELPEEFSLRQNFPNPFNPRTTIEYGLPASAEVRLTVYNIMGQEVATLVNQRQSAGFHSINFDASRLASGMYLYRIEAGEFTQTRKLMLVK